MKCENCHMKEALFLDKVNSKVVCLKCMNTGVKLKIRRYSDFEALI